MNAKHFHEEWSFRAIFTKDGKVVKECRYQATNAETFLTEEQARRGMRQVVSWSNAYLEGHGKDGEYDAFEVYAPVRRIVTEWEDL